MCPPWNDHRDRHHATGVGRLAKELVASRRNYEIFASSIIFTKTLHRSGPIVTSQRATGAMDGVTRNKIVKIPGCAKAKKNAKHNHGVGELTGREAPLTEVVDTVTP